MGFISPIFISKIDPEQIGIDPSQKRTSIFESEPIPMDTMLANQVRGFENVASVEAVIYRPALLYSKKILENVPTETGKDSTIVTYENKDVLCKGVNATYDWGFLEKNLVEGNTKNLEENELIVSSRIASILDYSLGDTVNIGFITNGSFPLKEYRIKAIYNTGFSDYDDKIIFCSMTRLQEYCGLSSTNYFDVSVSQQSGLQMSLYTNKGLENTRIYVNGKPSSNIVPILDTGSLHVEIESMNAMGTLDYFYYLVTTTDSTNQAFQSTDFNNAIIEGNRTSNIRLLTKAKRKVSINIKEQEVDCVNLISGYEIDLDDNNKIEETKLDIEQYIGLNNTSSSKYIQVSSVFEAERDLFVWLDLLDLNVYVIIVLMLIIGIVNAGSAILVVISVKRNFIGMMKAIGATNVLIRKVFLVHAGSIILKGLLIGNCIGLVAIFVQFTWNVVPLNPEIYYLNHVPVNLSVTMFLLINALSFSICLISLILPTWIISKINPIKSIKFN